MEGIIIGSVLKDGPKVLSLCVKHGDTEGIISLRKRKTSPAEFKAGDKIIAYYSVKNGRLYLDGAERKASSVPFVEEKTPQRRVLGQCRFWRGTLTVYNPSEVYNLGCNLEDYLLVKGKEVIVDIVLSFTLCKGRLYPYWELRNITPFS